MTQKTLIQILNQLETLELGEIEQLSQAIENRLTPQKESPNLTTSDNQDISEAKKPEKRKGFGIWKGKIWMSDDFDEPIEDMKDYM